MANSRQRRTTRRKATANRSKRVLDRFKVFQWLRRHRKATGGGGLALAFACFLKGIDWQLDNARVSAALAFLAAWAVFGFVLYVSIFWDKRRWRAALVQILAGAGLIVLWWSYLPMPPTRDQDRQLKEIADLLKNQDRFQPNKLLERYPRGYLIYELNYSNQVFPYSKQLLDGYDIDWKSAQIVAVSDNEVTIQLPYINNPEKRITFSNITASLSKRVGATTATLRVEVVDQFVELVAIRETGFVFLIGFKDAPQEWKRLFGVD